MNKKKIHMSFQTCPLEVIKRFWSTCLSSHTLWKPTAYYNRVEALISYIKLNDMKMDEMRLQPQCNYVSGCYNI